MERLRAFFGARRVRVVGGALALLLLGAAIGGVAVLGLPAFAASQNGTAPLAATDAAKYCQTYEQALASKLNVSVAQLEAAHKDALTAALQQAVTDGKLTQAQATQIEQRLAAAPSGQSVCAGLARFARGDHRGLPGDLGAARQAVLSAVASKLGLTATDLETQLENGGNIVTIASQHNVNQATLNQTILAAVKTQLDAAQTSGKITQAQHDAALTRITTAVNAGKYGAVGLAEHGPRGFGR